MSMQMLSLLVEYKTHVAVTEKFTIITNSLLNVVTWLQLDILQM